MCGRGDPNGTPSRLSKEHRVEHSSAGNAEVEFHGEFRDRVQTSLQANEDVSFRVEECN